MKTLQRTFAIVKPDAVARAPPATSSTMLQKNGFRIIGMKMMHINKPQAEGFYAVHAAGRSSTR